MRCRIFSGSPWVSRVALDPSGVTRHTSYRSFNTTASSSFVQPTTPNMGRSAAVLSDSRSTNDVLIFAVMFVAAFVARLIVQ